MTTLVNEVPDTGSVGQVVKKTGTGVTDYAFQTIYEVPSTGANDQVLKKFGSGATQYQFETILEVPSGGSTGQVLTKTSTGYAWQTLPTSTNMRINTVIRRFSTNQDVSYTVPSGDFARVGASFTTSEALCVAGAVIRYDSNSVSTSYVTVDGGIIFQKSTGFDFGCYIVVISN